jgi:hypothetical protein
VLTLEITPFAETMTNVATPYARFAPEELRNVNFGRACASTASWTAILRFRMCHPESALVRRARRR